MTVKYVPIIITIYLFILSFLKERQLLGCSNHPVAIIFNNPVCDNVGSPIISKLRNKKITMKEAYDDVVLWRRAYLLSFVIVMLNNAFGGKYDIDWGVLNNILISSFVLYFSYNFYDYHLYRYILSQKQ
jgi:hypothetical protein